MPIPALENFSPEHRSLVERVESDLHLLVRLTMSRDDAIDLKGRFARPLGILNSRHGLKSESEAKSTMFHLLGRKMLVDTD